MKKFNDFLTEARSKPKSGEDEYGHSEIRDPEHHKKELAHHIGELQKHDSARRQHLLYSGRGTKAVHADAMARYHQSMGEHHMEWARLHKNHLDKLAGK